MHSMYSAERACDQKESECSQNACVTCFESVPFLPKESLLPNSIHGWDEHQYDHALEENCMLSTRESRCKKKPTTPHLLFLQSLPCICSLILMLSHLLSQLRIKDRGQIERQKQGVLFIGSLLIDRLKSQGLPQQDAFCYKAQASS